MKFKETNWSRVLTVALNLFSSQQWRLWSHRQPLRPKRTVHPTSRCRSCPTHRSPSWRWASFHRRPCSRPTNSRKPLPRSGRGTSRTTTAFTAQRPSTTSSTTMVSFIIYLVIWHFDFGLFADDSEPASDASDQISLSIEEEELENERALAAARLGLISSAGYVLSTIYCVRWLSHFNAN